ncbi:MAG: acetolactate synthase small subunit [Candidatus Adiutrix intracellularis]|jgi:acetolactate synthase-1/3 small subunit|nr:acetolactate synthase small subunit [Candidatus Adiutrix intracellularis]
MKKMISLLVHNRPGVLSHVAGLITRRGYNVESIAAGLTENATRTRISLVVSGDEWELSQVTKQLSKLIDCIEARDIKYSEAVIGEVALVNLDVEPERRPEIMTLVNIFGMRIADLDNNTLILQVVGSTHLVDMILNGLAPYRIKTIARTGLVVLPSERCEKQEHFL